MKYKYTVIYKMRKTISVSVNSQNEITVRCPWGVHEWQIEKFLESKRKWLDKVVFENALRLSKNTTLLDFKEILVGGVKLPLEISDKNQITETAVYVKSLGEIQNLFINTYADCFVNFVKSLAEEMRVTVNNITLKFFKGKWGCCDSKSNLSFNYILFMLPEDVKRYLVIHELSHTICFNHTKAFWKLVEEYEPSYNVLRNKLKSFDFLINIYSNL